jgi:hypothetical protein
VDYWQGAKSVGRFEADFFDPVAWRPEYPNPAFDNMRADDAFWGAQLVARFSGDIITAIVAKARYSEPDAAEHVARTLMKRREKVLRAWLTGVNPIVNPQLGADGTLTFENAALAAGAASGPAGYTLAWSRFDNATSANVGPVAELHVTEPKATAPPAIADGAEYLSVSIRTSHADFPNWSRPTVVHFRRSGNGWQTVGLERN